MNVEKAKSMVLKLEADARDKMRQADTREDTATQFYIVGSANYRRSMIKVEELRSQARELQQEARGLRSRLRKQVRI